MKLARRIEIARKKVIERTWLLLGQIFCSEKQRKICLELRVQGLGSVRIRNEKKVLLDFEFCNAFYDPYCVYHNVDPRMVDLPVMLEARAFDKTGILIKDCLFFVQKKRHHK